MKSVDRPCPPFSMASRYTLSIWFLHFVGKVRTLRDLSTGEDYCLILTQIFPTTVQDTRKIKQSPRNDLDKIHNWKIFQRALGRLKVTKEIPIMTLMRPNSALMLEFCRWFVTFIEVNIEELERLNSLPPKEIKLAKSTVVRTISIINQKESIPITVISQLKRKDDLGQAEHEPDQTTQKESTTAAEETQHMVSQQDLILPLYHNKPEEQNEDKEEPGQKESMTVAELSTSSDSLMKELDQPTQKESKSKAENIISLPDYFTLVTPRTRQREERFEMATAKQLGMTSPCSSTYDPRIRESLSKTERTPIRPIRVPPRKLVFDQTPKSAKTCDSPSVLNRWELFSRSPVINRLNFAENEESEL